MCSLGGLGHPAAPGSCRPASTTARGSKIKKNQHEVLGRSVKTLYDADKSCCGTTCAA
jgi:hypothetical protein